MGPKELANGLIMYLGLVILLTFHEYGHAFAAWKCGDDTARLQGRVSLNPLVHLDPIGTVVLPLLMILLPGAGRFLVGWAKPVPVNPANLRSPDRDDVLITLAGPAMNLLLGLLFLALTRVGLLLHSSNLVELCLKLSHLSLLLCFFNLLPIPPLDGSRVARVILQMSHDTYQHLSRYGFLILIVLLQVPAVMHLIGGVTHSTWTMIGQWFGIPLR